MIIVDLAKNEIAIDATTRFDLAQDSHRQAIEALHAPGTAGAINATAPKEPTGSKSRNAGWPRGLPTGLFTAKGSAGVFTCGQSQRSDRLRNLFGVDEPPPPAPLSQYEHVRVHPGHEGRGARTPSAPFTPASRCTRTVHWKEPRDPASEKQPIAPPPASIRSGGIASPRPLLPRHPYSRWHFLDHPWSDNRKNHEHRRVKEVRMSHRAINRKTDFRFVARWIDHQSGAPKARPPRSARETP